jgi:hypothetical protein
MAKGYPVLFSLSSGVKSDVFFNAILVVPFKANPVWTLLLLQSERSAESFLSFVVRFDVTLIALCSKCLRVSLIITIQRPHVCAIPKIKHHVWLEVIEELSQCLEAEIACLRVSVGAGKDYYCFLI